MYTVECRVNGALVDEERCASFVQAQEVVNRLRRALVTAVAAIVVEDIWQYVLARTADGWVTVTIADEPP